MTDALITAEKLVRAGAVILRPNEPFIWASGWKSPIYCDNRVLLSDPYIRDFIKSELANAVFQLFPDTECIAGVATAGIPWGAMVADQLKLPFIYVRSKPKEHGKSNQIEGKYHREQKVLVLEDLISTGMSSLQVVEALKQSELAVQGVVSIFSYEFKTASHQFEEQGIPVVSLTNYTSLIQMFVQNGQLTPLENDILLKWRNDPAAWTGIN